MRTHDGFFLRIGGGFATLGGSIENKNNSSDSVDLSGSGFGIDFGIGGTVGRGLVLGGGASSAAFTDPKIKSPAGDLTLKGTATATLVGGLVVWYPSPTGGFNVGALVGRYAISFKDDGGTFGNSGTEFDAAGIGYSAHLGYDMWIGPQSSLSLYGRFVGGSAEADFINIPAKYKPTVLTFGVGYTYH